MIGPEQKELYQEFKKIDLETLKPFILQSDLFQDSPLEEELEEEFETYQRDLSRLLNEPETYQQLTEITQIQGQITELNNNWKKKEKELKDEISPLAQRQNELRAQINEVRRAKQARPTIIKEDKDEPISDALSWVLVKAANRGRLARTSLNRLGLVSLDPTSGDPFPYQFRQPFKEQATKTQELKKLKEKRGLSQKQYQQTRVARDREKETLEKAILDKFTDWATEDRDRIIILVLNNPDSLEKWTSAYLQRVRENPTQEEVLAYLSWALQTYRALKEGVNPDLFSQWASLCFKEKSPQPVTDLLSPRKSQEFNQGLKHPKLRKDFNQFLRWWLGLELESYGFPAQEERPLPYFIPAVQKRKPKKMLKEEIAPTVKVFKEPLYFLIGEEKLIGEEELPKYLKEVLGHHIEPKDIPYLSDRILQTAQQIRDYYFSPHFRILRGPKARARGRIKCPRHWRILANIISLNGASLNLVGALHRDWGYEGGRVISFT